VTESGAGPAGAAGRAPAGPADVWPQAGGPAFRVGLGYDAHRFAPDRALVLGGVRLREHDGLLGHSDADVVVHAIMDAFLGAAGLEDIGHYFPDSDPAFAGADSISLLDAVVVLLRDRGWQPVNVDVVVICEEPRIAPHRTRMRERLAAALGVEPDAVGIRGTTTEGMGFTGRREGMAAQAVALVERSAETRRYGKN
jgi:2-C-methyl-D-erythritol 2,4-cyclodiphosphate synthase